MTKTIEDRTDIYGRPACLICGQPKDLDYRDDVSHESVFAGERYQLTCRNHPGHPLFNDRGKHENRADAHEGQTYTTAPTRHSATV